MGKTNIPGGWLPGKGGAILDLASDLLKGINAPEKGRLMIASQEAGYRLYKWLVENGFDKPTKG